MTEEAPVDFDSFFGRTFTRVRALAILLSGHPHDADDAVQNAYIEALRRWEKIRDYDAPEAWVIMIMKQRLARLARENRRQQALALRLPVPSAATPEQTAEARDVLTALAALPHPQRAAMILHCLYGHRYKEVAEMLGLRSGTVRVGVYRARQTLRHQLGGTRTWGPGHDPEETLVDDVRGTPASPLVQMLRTAEDWLLKACQADATAFTRTRETIVAAAHTRAPR
jgi:RNA polymerase sigma factor (sigma-70 family)